MYVGFSRIFLLGLTARRLYKTFGVKGLKYAKSQFHASRCIGKKSGLSPQGKITAQVVHDSSRLTHKFRPNL
jgi:hypothetical protein